MLVEITKELFCSIINTDDKVVAVHEKEGYVRTDYFKYGVTLAIVLNHVSLVHSYYIQDINA